VTAVVLVVRSALQSDTSRADGPRPAASTRGGRVGGRPKTPLAPKRWYVIRSGDTLGAIAARFGTTVDVLLRLNPGVHPGALIPGEQVRIR